jgi:hypothetical protein
VEVRDLPPLACRSRVAKLRAAEPGGAGEVGAALTKPGRVRIARCRGFGERDEEEYARNRRYYVPRKVNQLKSGGYGLGAVRTGSGVLAGAGNSRAVMWMSSWEATVKCCGVVVAMPQG